MIWIGVRKPYEQLPKPNNQPGLGRGSIGGWWADPSTTCPIFCWVLHSLQHVATQRKLNASKNCSGVSSVLQVDSLAMIYIDYTVPMCGFLESLYQSSTLTLQTTQKEVNILVQANRDLNKFTRGYERKPSSRHDPQNR